MDTAVDQALYGYDNGHRLIATSTAIDKESSRSLRSVTDLKVGPSSHSYLTVLPLTAMRKHAFIRTWSAGPGFRPGSVWSHVLLMRQEDFDGFADFPALLQAFSKPEVVGDADLPSLRTRYDRALRLEPSRKGPETPWSPKVARQLVSAAYSTAEPVEVVLERADSYDHLLLSLLGQMWPELRRGFRLRTRYRRTGSTVATFAIEVVERASTLGASPKHLLDAWVDVLAHDLEFTNMQLRNWLWHCGPEGPSDRPAMVPLVNIFAAARSGDPTDVIEHLRAAYPSSEQMTTLKLELFGGSTSIVRFAAWPATEEGRLQLALQTSSALDLDRLQVEDRLATLAHADAPGLLRVLNYVNWDNLEEPARDDLTGALIRGLDEPGLLAAAAISRSDLTVPLLSARPDTWYQGAVWSNPIAADVVRSLLTKTTDDVRSKTLRGLVSSGQKEPASELCEQHPYLWWSLLDADNAAALLSSQVAQNATRAALTHVSAKAVGPPPFPLTTVDQLDVLARVSDPDDRLWEGAAPAAWLDLVEQDRKRREHGAEDEVFKAQVIALAAAEASHDVPLRGRAWTALFGDLHRYMASFGPPKGTERTLDRTLPGGPRWDWCGRLREGLARVAVDGRWDLGLIHTVASGAADFSDDVARRVEGRTRDKSGTFLEELWSLFHL